jgi:hypothetical protein
MKLSKFLVVPDFEKMKSLTTDNTDLIFTPARLHNFFVVRRGLHCVICVLIRAICGKKTNLNLINSLPFAQINCYAKPSFLSFVINAFYFL